MTLLNLADWVECTEVEGPGKRFALWVQGCILRCPSCCNPHMLDLVPRVLVESRQVISWIEEAKRRYEIEGVTFLGGEPMLQARGLAEVADAVCKSELSVMVFTGYGVGELHETGLPGVDELLGLTDLLVDGPFIAEQLEQERNWAGSTNQRFHYLSSRYRPGIEYDPAYSHGFEVRFLPDGTVRVNGWPYRFVRSTQPNAPSKKAPN